jgi:hypothetical protein
MQLRSIILALIAVSAVVGCDRDKRTTITPMRTEQIIHQHRDSPVGESIDPIIKSLATQSLFVGTEGVTPAEDGKTTSNIRLKTGVDNQGRPWVYAYTSRVEFDRAFPQGGAFAEINFQDLFKIVETDQQFAGLNLNSASDTSYPIPRELFGKVRHALREMSGG